MSSQSCDVLILGAGPAGMAAAMELVRAGRQVTVVEKSAAVGGLARTLTFEEKDGTYRTDIGPHRFYSKNRYLYDFIEDLLGEEWMKVPRLTRFVIDGKFYFYPVKLGNVLSQIGLLKAVQMMKDFGIEKIRSKTIPRKIRTFEDYAVANFGRSLAEFNMLNYTEKIWGIPCNEINVDWATQRIGGLSVWATLKKAISGKGGPKSLVDTFYYPSKGCGLIYETIRQRIEEKGSEMLMSSEPESIVHDGKHVTEVIVRTPHGHRTFHPKAVVSSVPLTVSPALFTPAPPSEVMDAAKGLRFRSQVYLFLTVNKERLTADNWVYFPDKNIPFGRISEMKNFSTDMCPPGKTSLFIEFFCFEGDAIWNASKEELFAQSIPFLEKMNLLHREDVGSLHHFKIPHVYPLYDFEYANRAKTVLHWLDAFDNFFAVGRPGRFRYTNQDHSLEMGILAAQSILTGRRRDVDEVGNEQEYFEQGYVPGAKAA